LTATLGIRQAILGVSGVVIVSKLLGFLREMVIAERFGTSHEYDIFLIAIAIPVFLNLVISRATNFLTVPFLSKQAVTDDGQRDWRAVWSVFNSVLAVVISLIILVIVFAPYLVQAVGTALSGDDLRQAIFFCRVISIILLLGFLESLLRSALNVQKQFVYPAVGSIILNIVVITVIYIFSGKWSVSAIMFGLLLGIFLQVVFLSLKCWNFRLLKYFNLNLFGPEIKKVLGVGGIIIAVELIASTFFLIDRYYASDMQTGVVSALNYSNLLVMLPVNIAGFAIASVVFPYLSERSGSDKTADFTKLLGSSLSLALTIGIPCGVFYFLFARELIAAIFFRGAFDLLSLEMTSKILVTMAPYLVFMFLYTILIQACYSSERQKAVFYVSVLAIALKFVLTGLFKLWFGYPGIGAATSVVSGITVTLLIIVLVRRRRLDGFERMISLTSRVLIAAIPIILISLYYDTLPGFYEGISFLSKIRVVWAGLLSFLLFIVIGYIIKIDEVRSMMSGLRRRKV